MPIFKAMAQGLYAHDFISFFVTDCENKVSTEVNNIRQNEYSALQSCRI